MSCDGYSVKMPNGTELCIPIYRAIDKWGPDPDPEGRLFNDIRILATVNEGIAHISDRRVRDTLSQAVQGAVRSIELPKGLELGDRLFKFERAMEAAE